MEFGTVTTFVPVGLEANVLPSRLQRGVSREGDDWISRPVTPELLFRIVSVTETALLLVVDAAKRETMISAARVAGIEKAARPRQTRVANQPCFTRPS